MKRFITDWEPRGIELEDEALVAVGSTSKSALVIAGPGAGKTEMLAQRASFLFETGACAAPRRILAISFKRDAAYNLQERVTLRCNTELSQRFDSRTYSGWAKGLIDRFRLALPAEYRPTQDYVLRKLSDPEDFRSRLLRVAGRAGVEGFRINNLSEDSLKEIFRNRILGPLAIEAPSVSRTPPTLTRCWWDAVLHGGSCSVLDFGMLEVLAELLLSTNPQIVAALRAAYAFVFLDEFQDTTHSQYRLLETAFKGSSAVLTAVGDHKQRIMGWAGAYDKAFETFRESFGAEDFRLIKNHRSAPRLVQIQGHFIRAFDPQGPMPEATDIGETGEGECRILSFRDNQAEGLHLAKEIQSWIEVDGVCPTDICVIVRQTKNGGGYTSELCRQLEQRAIRCRIQDDFQNLLTEPLTIAIVDAFKLCAAPQSPQSWQALLTLIFRIRGVSSGEDSTGKARKVAAEQSTFIKRLRSKMEVAKSLEDIQAMIGSLLAFIGQEAFCRIHEQYLQTSFFQQTANDCAQALLDARKKAPSWVQALDDFLGVNTVPIMTIHKSKGLEYHTVVFVGLEDYPFRGYNQGKVNATEEDCNFFVAFSRAKKRVWFTFAGLRPNGRNNQVQLQQRTAVSNLYQLMQRAGVSVENMEARTSNG